MYKAIEKIGEYKKGDVVPDEKAKVWESMYDISPVEKITEVKKCSVEKKIIKSEARKSSSDVMLDDYISRNGNVVIKNVETDGLDKLTLTKLLVIERNNKNRNGVISAIQNKIKE